MLPGKSQKDDQTTIGVEFWTQDLVNGKDKIRLMLMDFRGEERFRFLLHQYCRGANAAFFLYDVTKSQTLNHMEGMLKIIRQNSRDIPISLIGIIPNENPKRQVSVEEGAKIAEENKLNSFIEINAITRENVGEAYETITRILLAKSEWKLPKKLYRYLPKSSKNTQKSFKVKSKRIDKDNNDEDAHFTYPYIFKPPEPPDDFAMAPQILIRPILVETDPEEEIHCQYCGIKLTKEEEITHSCKKKP